MQVSKLLACVILLSSLVVLAKSSAQQTTSEQDESWQFDGCYTSDKPDTILPYHVMEGDYMTQAFCRDRCQAQSFKLFGLMSGTKCYCGAAVKNAWKVENHKCTWKCPGNPKESCGGDTAMQVFKTSADSQHSNKKEPPPSDKKIRCTYQPDETSKEGKRLVCVANLRLSDMLGNG